MWSTQKPAADVLRTQLERARNEPLNYDPVGFTRRDGKPTPRGYVLDLHRRQLGAGRAAFDAACAALRRWEMFRLGWADVADRLAPIAAGTTVGVLARAGGLWCLNTCRIVYDVSDARRFGFAYGTLPQHVESGEERFTIEWRDDDSVWYDLRAISRPNRWYVRLGYPFARHLQRRFAADSLDAMTRAVTE